MKYGLKKFAACAFCLLLCGELCACGSPYKHSSLIEAKGQVKLQRANEELLLTADSGLRLKEGDLITSQADGSAWFWLDRYKSILLGPSSGLRVSHYGRGFNLSLNEGLLFVRIDKTLAASELFEVTTKNVVLSVRGTVFSVEYQSSGEVLLNVFQGRVALCESTGGELITIEKNQSLTYDPENGRFEQQAGPIRFDALPALVADCVADYKNEAKGGAAYAPTSAASSASVSSSPAASEPPGASSSSTGKSASIPASGSSVPATPAPPPLYSVIFDLNGGTLGPVTQPILREVQQGQAVLSPGNPEQKGFTFTGWFLDPRGSVAAELSSIEKNLTVYAGWAAASTEPPMQSKPRVQFKYIWDGAEFRPAADISWETKLQSGFLVWQVYDPEGNAAAQSGRLGGNEEKLILTDCFFEVSAPFNGLYPKDCTLKLSAYDSTEQTALWEFVMELPYFELSHEAEGEDRRPVIATNLGLYFHHSLQNISVVWQQDHFEAQGTLYPLLGQSVPLTLQSG